MFIIDELNKHFEKVFEKLGHKKELARVSFSARPELCDFQLNAAFQLAKELHKNPLDIANMVMYLCSDAAGFITGENICIDGGMTKQMIYHGDFG